MIHASDAVAAAAAGAKGYLPPRTAALTTLISTVNTGLAVAARGKRHPGLTGVAGAAVALGTGVAVATLARRGEDGDAGRWRLPPVAALAAVRRRGRGDRPQGRLGQAADPARPGRAGLRNTLRKQNLHDTSASRP